MLKVSVIIPTYNSAGYIVDAIESVLSQTYKLFEIIVVDDGSSDNTKDILKQYIETNKIRYFYQQNKGPSAARNKGIEESKGEYIGFLDADDMWDKEKIKKSKTFMDLHNFDWICTSMIEEKQGQVNSIRRIPEDSPFFDQKSKEIKLLEHGLFFFSSLEISTPTVLVKKACFEKAGFFDESFFIGEDTDLYLRFTELGLRAGYLEEPLTTYRCNDNSLTRGKKIDGMNEYLKLGKKHALILGLDNPFIRKSYAEFLWQIADRYHMFKQYTKSAKCVLRSLYYNPFYLFRVYRRIFITRKL